MFRCVEAILWSCLAEEGHCSSRAVLRPPVALSRELLVVAQFARSRIFLTSTHTATRTSLS